MTLTTPNKSSIRSIGDARGPEHVSGPVGRVIDNLARDVRQQQIADWCVAAFGAAHAKNLAQRGVRMLEEAVEAFQAATPEDSADHYRAMAHRLVDYVFSRERGELAQELGGVGLTVLCLANAAGLSADSCERDEAARVLAKPLEHFARRNAEKNAAGFVVGDAA